MDDLLALYTAARRYVGDRIQEFRTRFFDRVNEPSPPFNVWPRVESLEALLADIESVTSDEFPSLDTLREYLLLAGATATSVGTKRYASVATDLMDEERRRFSVYISNLTSNDLREIAPLPYRRRLSVAECERAWNALDRRWGTRGGKEWYPLTQDEPPGIIAFQAAWFHHVIPDEYLSSLLGEHGIARCWELYEHGWVHEIAVELLSTHHGHNEGMECYATTNEMDWLIYASHESSVTLAGDWLIEAVKARWPEWEQHLYTGWDYERPQEAVAPNKEQKR